MSNAKIMSGFKKYLLFAGLTIVFSLIISGPSNRVLANGSGPEYECENYIGGTWNPGDQTCTLKQSDFPVEWDSMVREFCMGNIYTDAIISFPSYNTITFKWNGEYFVFVSCSNVSSSHPLLNRCKLFDIESPVPVGTNHPIKVTFMGYPSYLRLNDGEQFYRLPVIPGSTHYAGDNKWTAEFATADLLTGAGLAPIGKYKVRCFGPSGTAGGVDKVTLTK